MTKAVVQVEPVIRAHAKWRYLWTLARRDGDVMGEAWEWYPRMNHFVRGLEDKYGKMYPHMSLLDWCCFVSIMSARVSVKVNVRNAELLAKHGPDSIFNTEIPYGGTKVFLCKAARILQGEAGTDVLRYERSMKTYHFARDICHPNTFRQHATIDVWMLKAVEWYRKSMSELEYESLESGLVGLALEYDVPTMVVQAAVWRHFRGRSW